MKINADRGKVFRRKHDGVIMGATIVLGIDYSTGVARTDLPDYYEQISNPTKQVVIETYVAEQELDAVKTNFPDWTPGEQVWAKEGDKPADLRQYKEHLYKCVQSHVTQADWDPEITNQTLWEKVIVIDPAVKPPQWLSSDWSKYTPIGFEVFDSGKVWKVKTLSHTWIQPALTGNGSLSWTFVKDWVD